MAKTSGLFALALAVKKGARKLDDVPRGLKGHVTRLARMPQEELARYASPPAVPARAAPAHTSAAVRRIRTT